MKELENDMELIRSYLNGSLSQQDHDDFERQLLLDPFLADAVEGYRQVPSGLNKGSLLAAKKPFSKSLGGIPMTLFFGIVLICIAWMWPQDQLAVLVTSEPLEGVPKKELPNMYQKELIQESKYENAEQNESEEECVIVDGVDENEVIGGSELMNLSHLESVDSIRVVESADLSSIEEEASSQLHDLNLSPYLAFTENKLKFMLIQPMGNLSKSQKRQLEKQRERLERQVDLGISILEKLKNHQFAKVEDQLKKFRKDKNHDPEMYAWLQCLYQAQSKEWGESLRIVDSLQENRSQVGLQSTKLKLEIMKLQSSTK